jgi:hypothetical protein
MWNSLLDGYDPADRVKDTVSLDVVFPMPWNITFTTGSHGGRLVDERELVHWQKMGSAAATMGFKSHDGKVSHPVSCAGMHASLLFNSLGTYRDLKCEDAGFIGDGWAEGNTFLFRVYVNYHIARGLIDQIYTYSRLGKGAENPDDAFNLQFDLMNLEQLTVSGRERLAYGIVGLVA